MTVVEIHRAENFPTLATAFVRTVPAIDAFLNQHSPPVIAKVYRPTQRQGDDAAGRVELWYPQRFAHGFLRLLHLNKSHRADAFRLVEGIQEQIRDTRRARRQSDRMVIHEFAESCRSARGNQRVNRLCRRQ